MRYVQAPAAAPRDLLSFIGNLSSSSVDAPRSISSVLAERLHLIAARHDGMVPLHSRLFAQWLHFAFPLDCPYPEMIEDATALRRAAWNRTRVESKQAVAQHIRDIEALGDSDEEVERLWSDDEIVLLEGAASGEGWLCGLCLAHVVFLTTAIGSTLSLLWSFYRATLA